jgi:hypothetical protein
MASVKTFVVRLFVPAASNLRPQPLQGVVENVADGRSRAFGSGEDLLAFLATTLEDAAGVRERRGPPVRTERRP